MSVTVRRPMPARKIAGWPVFCSRSSGSLSRLSRQSVCMRMRRVRAHSMAEEADASIATMSCACWQPSRVRESTRLKVSEASKRLNDMLSASVRNLARGRPAPPSGKYEQTGSSEGESGRVRPPNRTRKVHPHANAYIHLSTGLPLGSGHGCPPDRGQQ